MRRCRSGWRRRARGCVRPDRCVGPGAEGEPTGADRGGHNPVRPHRSLFVVASRPVGALGHRRSPGPQRGAGSTPDSWWWTVGLVLGRRNRSRCHPGRSGRSARPARLARWSTSAPWRSWPRLISGRSASTPISVSSKSAPATATARCIIPSPSTSAGTVGPASLPPPTSSGRACASPWTRSSCWPMTVWPGPPIASTGLTRSTGWSPAGRSPRPSTRWSGPARISSVRPVRSTN